MIHLIQIETSGQNLITLLIGAISIVVSGIVTLFLIYRKAIKEHATSLKEHNEVMQKIYETVVKETNALSQKNTQAVEMNTMATKDLSNFIRQLPGDIKNALRD